jgi:hypothetical protein
MKKKPSEKEKISCKQYVDGLLGRHSGVVVQRLVCSSAEVGRYKDMENFLFEASRGGGVIAQRNCAADQRHGWMDEDYGDTLIEKESMAGNDRGWRDGGI